MIQCKPYCSSNLTHRYPNHFLRAPFSSLEPSLIQEPLRPSTEVHSDLSGQPNSHTQWTMALHASSEASLSCFQECSSRGLVNSVPLSRVLQNSPQTRCLFPAQICFRSYSQQSLKTFPELIRVGLAWPGASFWTWPGQLFHNPMSHIWPILVSVPWLWQNTWSKPRKKGWSASASKPAICGLSGTVCVLVTVLCITMGAEGRGSCLPHSACKGKTVGPRRDWAQDSFPDAL